MVWNGVDDERELLHAVLGNTRQQALLGTQQETIRVCAVNSVARVREYLIFGRIFWSLNLSMSLCFCLLSLCWSCPVLCVPKIGPLICQCVFIAGPSGVVGATDEEGAWTSARTSARTIQVKGTPNKKTREKQKSENLQRVTMENGNYEDTSFVTRTRLGTEQKYLSNSCR